MSYLLVPNVIVANVSNVKQKTKKPLKTSLTLISTLTICKLLKQHLKVFLNLHARLTFNDHINEKTGKAMKDVALLHRLHSFYHVAGTYYLQVLHKTTSELWRRYI